MNRRNTVALPGWLATTTRRECGRTLRPARGPDSARFAVDAETVPDELGEVEGLKVSLAGAEDKLTQITASLQRKADALQLGMPAFPDITGRSSSGRCLGVQELPPRSCWCGVRGAGGIFRALRTRRMVDTLTRWPSLSSSPWIRWYPHEAFSVASRSISAAISALTGGRPIRFG